MTDLEITKACAEALGFTVEGADWTDDRGFVGVIDGLPKRYDPLHDDAQAMALVKRFDMSLRRLDLPSTKGWFRVEIRNEWTVSVASSDGSDLNRAICECVAKMKERG